MTITYTKEVTALACYSQIDGETDVVFTVNWGLVGTDGPYAYTLPCSVAVPYVAGEPFTPYNELTQAQVVAWIDLYTAPEMMASYEQAVLSGIEKQKVIVTPPLPWVQPPVPETPEQPVELPQEQQQP